MLGGADLLRKQIAFEDPCLSIKLSEKPKDRAVLVPDSGARAVFFLLNFTAIMRLAPILFLLVFAFGCATTTTSTVPKGVYYSISQSSIDHGDPDKAIEGLSQIPKDQRDIKYYLLIARAYLMKGNYPLAVESYKKALEKDRLNEEAKQGIVKVYIKMARYDLAEKYLEELLKSKDQKTRIEAELDLGLIYLKQGKYTEAEMILLKVLEKDSENWQANFRLGLVYIEKGEYEKAVASLKKALSKASPLSQKAEVYYNLGLAYYKKGDIGSAKDAWMGAVKLDPYGEFGQKAQGKLDLL